MTAQPIFDSTSDNANGNPADSTGERIVVAATKLLVAGGREAVSTRAVCHAAGVQAPTLYRLFGDKEGMLDAVALHGFRTYLDDWTLRLPGPDPVEDLRNGWDEHVAFGTSNPYLYSLAYGGSRPGAPSPASAAAGEVLAAVIHRIAEEGRLRITETEAADVLSASGSGTVLRLNAMPAQRRNMAMSATVRDAMIARVTTDAALPAEGGPVGAAVHLRAALDETTTLSPGERVLLREWLDRITRAPVP